MSPSSYRRRFSTPPFLAIFLAKIHFRIEKRSLGADNERDVLSELNNSGGPSIIRKLNFRPSRSAFLRSSFFARARQLNEFADRGNLSIARRARACAGNAFAAAADRELYRAPQSNE